MPRIVPSFSSTQPVATEEELLAFANRLRVAGGANALDALLPSLPEDSENCLIARALNFKCQVTPWLPKLDGGKECKTRYQDGSSKWIMLPHRGNPKEQEQLARELATKLNLRLLRHNDAFFSAKNTKPSIIYGIQLPRHIGNSAEAFDEGYAFQEYVDGE